MKRYHWYQNGTGHYDCAGVVTKTEAAEIMRRSPYGADVIVREGIDPNAPRHVCVSASAPATALHRYAQRLTRSEHYQMARRLLAGERAVVFHVDGNRVTLAEQPVASASVVDLATGEEIVAAGQVIDAATAERLGWLEVA